ncbi:hypothetical protein [Pendulispora albinea]|uniref:Helicase XPB/Ssl2 N-terminal domain-containing protein n=1 Tax=Pendulispora albinea TaxID=2741071 RepID=A0ABZ2LPW8_9BACT
MTSSPSQSPPPVSPTPTTHRLVEILRAFPPAELESLIARLAIRIDTAKRLDVPSQVARVLVAQPDLRDSSRLPNACVELLHRVAEARGSLIVPTVPPALEPLSARGLMFARGGKGAVELILPPAYLVQLRTWEGEDPHGLRALLAQASPETMSAIASHYLGRPATQPFALSLEVAWKALTDPNRLEQEIERLAPTERRLLDGVDREGGEVSTEELLELEREPLRLRSASGPTPSRRGVGVSLERRGFLIPVYPNRHIVPTEVAAIVGATRLAERAQRREQVKSFVLTGDHAPRRAKFASDPSILAIGLAIVAREGGNEVRAGIGTPKSLVQRLATRFGRDPSQVAMLIALSRATGLWDASAMSASAPPGSLTMGELTPALFKTWRRGGAWDEARPEPELFRVSTESRDPSPVGVLREMVLDAVAELAEGGWVPWSSLAGYLKSDDRIPGISRLLRRWADRVGVEAIDPMDVAARIVHESLPALGVLDLGEEDAFASESAADGGAETQSTVTLRLTPRGRSLLFDRPLSTEITQSQFYDANVLRVGIHSRICNIMQIAPFVEVGRATDTIDLIVAPQTLSRALAAGFDPEALRQRIEALAPLPETLSRTLAQASVVVGRGSFVAAGGFLWVDDANVREMLRTRRATSELFVDPSPPGGLIVQPGVDTDRLSRRCRTVGVEIVAEGQVVRARTVVSSRPVSSRGSPTTR